MKASGLACVEMIVLAVALMDECWTLELLIM